MPEESQKSNEPKIGSKTWWTTVPSGNGVRKLQLGALGVIAVMGAIFFGWFAYFFGDSIAELFSVVVLIDVVILLLCAITSFVYLTKPTTKIYRMLQVVCVASISISLFAGVGLMPIDARYLLTQIMGAIIPAAILIIARLVNKS